MKHAYLSLIFLVVLLCSYWTEEAAAQNVPKTEPLTVVFKLKPEASAATARSAGTSPIQQALQRVASSPAVQKFPHASPKAVLRSAQKKAVDLSLIYQLKYKPELSFMQVKKQLLSTGLVEYVEPLYQYEPLQLPNDPKADSVTGSQTYLKKIQAYKGWDISAGDSNVVIGILDTGVRLSHEDLKGNLKYNYADPIDGIDNDQDGYIDNFHGWDMADGDNDPTADANGHGTSVTGIAAAQANNGVGIAGVGFKSKFLPIKIFSSKSDGPFKGYEGIVYAADRGVKVINLSWGAASFWSAYEQDVINYAAINKDVVIVPAAGNTNDHLDFYPASYDNVLSVSALDKNDVKGANNTYSYKIDIGALGIGTYTTGNTKDNDYGNGNGSSVASPIVAGAAALLRSHFPSLSALQIAERLRVTADDIYGLPGNAAYLEKLGKGRINVYKALSEAAPKSVRLTSWNQGGASSLAPGEVVQLNGTFMNFLHPVSGLTVTLTSGSQYVEVLQGSYSAGSMGTMESKSNQATPFKFKIADNTPPNTPVTLRFGFSDGSYTDYQHMQLVLNPSFVTTDVNDLVASIMSTANLGYDGLNYSQGLGVTYKGSAPMLAEGALLIGYSETEVSDNIRNEKGSTDHDFYALTSIQRLNNSPHADFHASNLMEDSLTATKTKSLNIQQNIFAWKDEPNRGYVLLEYVLTNRTSQPISNAYAGVFADWDLVAAGSNLAQWNSQLKLGLVRHATDTSLWAGVQLVSGGAPGYYALENSATGQSEVNMGDGFSTKEKYLALSGGVKKEQAGADAGKDVSFIISSAIRTLAPGERDTVAFALVAGSSRTEFLQNAAAAMQKYQQLTIARTVTSSPGALPLENITLFPNPSRGQVEVTLPGSLQQAAMTVQLVNSQGQVLPQGVFQRQGRLSFDFSHLPSGMYYLKFISTAGVVTKKLMLTR